MSAPIPLYYRAGRLRQSLLSRLLSSTAINRRPFIRHLMVWDEAAASQPKWFSKVAA